MGKSSFNTTSHLNAYLNTFTNHLFCLISIVRLQKLVKDLNKYIQTQDKGPWPQAKVSATDRALGEISRIMEKRVSMFWLKLVTV